MTELLLLALVVLPIAAGAVAWLVPVALSRALALGSIAVSVAAGLVLSVLAITGSPIRAFDGLVVLDSLGAYVLGLTVLVGAISAAGSPRYLRHEVAHGELRPRDEQRYWSLLALFVGGLAAIPLLDNLGLLWVAIEATTMVAALLVGISRTREAIEAAWKYLILGTIGIGFALLGTLLAYASSVPALGESSDALAWTHLMAVASQLDPGLLRLAFVFALVGYGTKMGLAPFHTWLPDAHSQAPSPISALLSGATLNAALYALLRFHMVAVGGLGEGFSSTLLIAIGLLTLAVALPFMVSQEDVKRLLAYSSVEHMGILAIAIGFGGPLALSAGLLHMGLHALAKSTVFIAAGELVQQYGTRRIGRIRGSLERSPVAGTIFGVGILLLGGMPPSGVFVTELAIIVGGVTRGYALPAAIAALLFGLAFAALTFHTGRLTFGRKGAIPPKGARSPRGWTLALRLAPPLLVVCLLGVWTPAELTNALDAVVTLLGNARG